VKSYVYAQDDLIAQYNGPQDSAAKYFYICDRLGNVRQVIDINASVQYLYTYGPFGKVIESDEDADPPGNAFQFTGQFYDADLNQYYLRARQYSPDLARFTARDPDKGNFHEPFSLHAYLYCLDDPINQIDPQGESSFSLGGMLAAVSIGLYFANYANAPAAGDYTFADNSGEMVTGMAGCIILAGVGQGVGKIVWPWLKNRIIINRLLGRPGSKFLSPNSTRGWKVGDPINNLTKSGKVPSWSTTRARYWKNRAHYTTKGEFTEQNLERMRKGLAPQQYNSTTGKWESMELHHVEPMREGGQFYFIELWPEEHAALDPYRYLGSD
jgi:RHS repeat-associated protein